MNKVRVMIDVGQICSVSLLGPFSFALSNQSVEMALAYVVHDRLLAKNHALRIITRTEYVLVLS
jgi:hypothetical protein